MLTLALSSVFIPVKSDFIRCWLVKFFDYYFFNFLYLLRFLLKFALFHLLLPPACIFDLHHLIHLAPVAAKLLQHAIAILFRLVARYFQLNCVKFTLHWSLLLCHIIAHFILIFSRSSMNLVSLFQQKLNNARTINQTVSFHLR